MFKALNPAPLSAWKFSVELRQEMAWYWQALIITLSLLFGMFICALILMAAKLRKK